MDESYLTILAHEFRAGKGSFLIQLRINLRWDKEAFKRLTEAMYMCCKQYQYSQEQLDAESEQLEQITDEQLEDEQFTDAYFLQRQHTMLPRWIAEGFWYVPTFTRDWTSHPAWERVIAREPEYYQKAYQRLDDLASWFFDGHPSWGAGLRPLEDAQDQ